MKGSDRNPTKRRFRSLINELKPRLRITPRAATVAREFVFHPTQVLTDMPDGSLIVEFTASNLVEMARLLIIWGNDVEVLEPPELISILDEVRRGEVKVLP